MWIPYDLRAQLKAETGPATVESSAADSSERDILVGFFVRDPVTQKWEIDIKTDEPARVMAVTLGGRPTEIGFYGDSGKLNEIIYRVKASDVMDTLSACHRDVAERLARWALELGRGMAVAGWRVADPKHGARWRCTPFRPNVLQLDIEAIDDVPADYKPLLALYQQARNASDPAWRLLCAFAILRAWRDGEGPFSVAKRSSSSSQTRGMKLIVSHEMLAHSGALVCAPELLGQPLEAFVDRLEHFRETIIRGLEAPLANPSRAFDVKEQAVLAQMANLADLVAREVLLADLEAEFGRALSGAALQDAMVKNGALQ